MLMENSNDNNKVTVSPIVIICFLVLIIILVLFYLSHPTCLKYNDWWIKGRNISEVITRYGELDKDLGHEKGYYISAGNTWIMSDNQPQYYWMICDDNGIVYDVFTAGSPGG